MRVIAAGNFTDLPNVLQCVRDNDIGEVGQPANDAAVAPINPKEAGSNREIIVGQLVKNYEQMPVAKFYLPPLEHWRQPNWTAKAMVGASGVV